MSELRYLILALDEMFGDLKEDRPITVAELSVLYKRADQMRRAINDMDLSKRLYCKHLAPDGVDCIGPESCGDETCKRRKL